MTQATEERNCTHCSHCDSAPVNPQNVLERQLTCHALPPQVTIVPQQGGQLATLTAWPIVSEKVVCAQFEAVETDG